MKQLVVIAIALAALAAPAWAQTAEQLNALQLHQIVTGGPPAMSMPPPMPGAASCPPGTHWVEAGYARHAKWRPAHCAAN